MFVSLAKFVCIERAGSGARARTNQRAFLAFRCAADGCAGDGRPGHGQFVAVLLPEGSTMAAALPPGLRRRDRPRRKHQNQHYQQA